jgi:hypothetical protein
MKTSSKTIVTTLAAAGFALLAGAAYAFPPGGGPCGAGGGPGMGAWGGGPGMMRGGGYGPGPMARGYGPGAGFQPGAGPSANADARLAFLKDTLKITTGQQAAWDAYAAKAKEQANTMVAMRAQMANTPQNAQDRITQRTELMKQRVAGMEGVSTAFKELYETLTPEQKAIADQQVGGGMRFAQAGPRGGYGPGHGMRGHGPRW